MKRQTSWIIGGAVILLTVIGLSFVLMPQFQVYFYTPAEAKTLASSISQQTIKVGGMVQPGSVQWVPEDLNLSFVLTDLMETSIKVVHRGTPPDMFKENSGVVVEGHISAEGDQFIAQKLMVKHSEEYKAPDKGHSIDRNLLEKSIFKTE